MILYPSENNNSPQHCVDSIQHMLYKEGDQGPLFLPPSLQDIWIHDEVRGKKMKSQLKRDMCEEMLGITIRGKIKGLIRRARLSDKKGRRTSYHLYKDTY